MSVWLELAAQVKNATGEVITPGESWQEWPWKILRALETLSQKVANLESRKPEDNGRTI